MSRESRNLWIDLPIGFYRLLSWFLPKDFYKAYAREMELVFEDCCVEAYTSRGWPGALSEAARGTFDLLVDGVKENLESFFNDLVRQYAFLAVSFLAICGGGFISRLHLSAEPWPSPVFMAYMFAFVLGCSRPRSFWLTGIIISCMIPSLEFGLFSALAGALSGAGFRKGLDYGAIRLA